jgi:hypothetical protein
MSQTQQTRRRWLIIAGLGVALIIGAVLIMPRAVPPQATAETSPLEDSQAIGPANAPVTLVEYADFGCPSCKVWHEYRSDSGPGQLTGQAEIQQLDRHKPPIHSLDARQRHSGMTAL